MLTPFLERLETTEETVSEFAKQLKEVGQDEDEKVKTRIENIPPASLAALLSRNLTAVGSEEARIKGNERLAKSGPKETEAMDEFKHKTGIPWIDKMLDYVPSEEQA